LDENQQIGNSGKGKYTWLTGLTKCGKCNYAMTVVTNRGKRYFNCRGKTNLHKCEGQSVPIHVEDIERSVEKELLIRLKRIKDTALSIKEPQDLTLNVLKAETAKKEEEIQGLMNKLPLASEDIVPIYNSKLSALNKEKMALEEQLKKRKLESKVINVDFNVGRFLDGWLGYSLEEKKELAYKFISKVKIFDGEIEIEWRF
jgi:hypothetical protein